MVGDFGFGIGVLTGRILVAATLISLGGIHAAEAFEVDFNSSSVLSQLSRRNQAQFFPMSWGPGTGISGSGAMTPSGAHQTVHAAQSTAFAGVGSKLELSAFFKTKDPGVIGPSNSASYAELYLTRSPAGYRFTDHSAFVQVDVLAGGERIFGGPIQTGGGSFPGFSVNYPLGTVTQGNWYKLSIVYEYVALNQIGWNIRFDDYGSDGLAYQRTAIASSQVTPDFLGITTDPTLYAGFGCSSQVCGAIDNLALVIVPEPSGIALVLVVSALIADRRCRSCRC
jgi:hypothetical protein